ncbi:hypothetical protein RYX36_026616 [Vicia faba]
MQQKKLRQKLGKESRNILPARDTPAMTSMLHEIHRFRKDERRCGGGNEV